MQNLRDLVGKIITIDNDMWEDANKLFLISSVIKRNEQSTGHVFILLDIDTYEYTTRTIPISQVNIVR